MKIITKIREAAVAALVAFGLFGLLAGPAAALSIPPNYAPRMFPDQMVHYVRFTVNFNSCVYVSSTCSFKVGALPYNAWLARLDYQGFTAFGSSTNTISIGTASGGAQILAATAFTATVAYTTSAAFAGVGISVTGNGTTQSGGNGGFDIWVTNTFTGTAPTAGQAVFVLEYIAPNDGSCQPVPMGATATAC